MRKSADAFAFQTMLLLCVIWGIQQVTIKWAATDIAPVMQAAIRSGIAAALVGLLMPVYSVFGQGLGPLPAITAVFLYSLLPILRNTYLALTGVEAGIREAGKGIGMTFWQRLRMVDIPLAVPVILAGVRTAVVMNIGVMTIAAVIGAGGLGVLILTSISQSNMPMLVVGAVLVSLLAIAADLLLQWLQRILTPKGLRASAH